MQQIAQTSMIVMLVYNKFIGQASASLVAAEHTMNATAEVSGTDMLLRGILNSLAPAGRTDAEGAGVPHWYSTYVSLNCLLSTTYKAQVGS